MSESLEERVTRLEAVYASIQRIDGKLANLDEKLNAIIRIEQKQAEHSSALDRAFKEIEAVDLKAANTEKSFNTRAGMDDGRRQTWATVYTLLQTVVLGAIGWQFYLTLDLKDAVNRLQTQFEYRIQPERETTHEFNQRESTRP